MPSIFCKPNLLPKLSRSSTKIKKYVEGVQGLCIWTSVKCVIIPTFYWLLNLKLLKKCMKLNWHFQMGVGRGEVSILARITLFFQVHLKLIMYYLSQHFFLFGLSVIPQCTCLHLKSIISCHKHYLM